MSETRSGPRTADRFTYLYSATVLGVAFLLLVYVGQYMEMVEIQIDVSRAQTGKRDYERKIERLRVRRAELARLGRLEFAAQERLGLVLPGQANVRYLPVADLAEGPTRPDVGGDVMMLSPSHTRPAGAGEAPPPPGPESRGEEPRQPDPASRFAVRGDGSLGGAPALSRSGLLDLREEGEVP